MVSAVEFAPLIGRLVRMERHATEREIAESGQQKVGMEAVVEAVVDVARGVEIHSDYGMCFLVRHDDHHLWRFDIRASKGDGT